MKTEKEAITEFLEAYKCLPCLWDQSDPLYKKRAAKIQAYKILLAKYTEIDKNATIQTVRKKIENFRTAYKREFKKIRAFAAHGNVHIPQLWYYNLLTFLDEPKDEPGPSSNTYYIREMSMESSNDSNEDQEDNDSKSLLAQMLMKNDSQEDDKQNSSDDDLKPVYIMDEDEPEDNRESLNIEEKDIAIRTEDNGESEAFGKSIGLQLKHLDSMQRNIAEKLISEIIFYGRLAKLKVDSTINI
ncbi:hypothetical protein JYU34_007292 [Plutella xylostella]|uniref:MADF domain-containing protein n=1 Tax=Plutella xylostella TaxID=51655 RepID=A0ABQ7QQ44_PLUXY|nr:hypothetical protein JYU34_007292 [Plutella xylostella]